MHTKVKITYYQLKLYFYGNGTNTELQQMIIKYV